MNLYIEIPQVVLVRDGVDAGNTISRWKKLASDRLRSLDLVRACQWTHGSFWRRSVSLTILFGSAMVFLLMT